MNSVVVLESVLKSGQISGGLKCRTACRVGGVSELTLDVAYLDFPQKRAEYVPKETNIARGLAHRDAFKNLWQVKIVVTVN